MSRFMRDIGVSYVQACRIYDTMVAVIEDGVCAGAKIKIGKVGSIHPVRRPPREVSMNFNSTQHIINLGPRICYKFRLYRQFMATRALNWFNES